MAATAVAIIVLFVQGIWCLPLEVRMSTGGGGDGESGNYQLTGNSRGNGLMNLMGRMLMANQGGLQSGNNFMNRAMSVPSSVVNHFASGQLGTQGTGGSSFNGNAPGILKTMGDMAGAALDVTDAGVQLGTGGAKMGAEMVGKTSSTMKNVVKDLLNGGVVSSNPNSYTHSSSFNFNSGGNYDNDIDVSMPIKGMVSTMRDMAGTAVDLVDQGIQMKSKGAQVIPKMVEGASSTIKDTVKGMIGSSGTKGSISSKVPNTQSVSSRYEYNSDSNSNGGSTGKFGESSYDLNMPLTGMKSTMRDLAGSAVDLVDKDIQLKMKAATFIPKMVGLASSTTNGVMKDMIGSSGGSILSKEPSTQSMYSTYEHNSGSNSNGGSTGSSGGSSKHVSYGLSLPGTGMVSTMRDMAGSAVDTVDNVVQMGTKGAQVMPKMASDASSTIKDVMKDMIGSSRIGDISSFKVPITHSFSTNEFGGNYNSDSSSRSKEPNTQSISSTYKSGSNSNGGSTGSSDGSSKHVSYGLSLPGTGMVSTMRDMAGSAVDMVDNVVQMGTKGAQVMPKMVGGASTAMKDTMKSMMGSSGDDGSSSSNGGKANSVRSTYSFQSGGNMHDGSTRNSRGSSHGDSSKLYENTHELTIPGTGMISAVRDMAGPVMDLADQTVQVGADSARFMPELTGQLSSSASKALRGMIGSSKSIGGSSSSTSSHDVKEDVVESSS